MAEFQDKSAYNEDIARAVASSMPDIKPTMPGVLSQKLKEIADGDNFEIDYSKFSPQAIASQMGSVLENVYEEQMKSSYHVENVFYYKGEDIAKEINEMRKSGDRIRIEAYKQKLINTLFFSEDYTNKILQVEGIKKSLHLPDVIVIDLRGSVPKIKCAEMKASGQNDSSSVPENIDKLAFGTRNSAVEAYASNGNIILERAILITATAVSKDGKYPNKTKWTNEIEKRREALGDIKVFCNEEAFSWLSGKDMSKEVYNQEFINTTAYAELLRLKKVSDT